MVSDRPLKHLAFVALLAVSAHCPTVAPAEPESCGVGSEKCLTSCKRFEARDPKLAACNHFCRKETASCATPLSTPIGAPSPSVEPPLSTQTPSGAESSSAEKLAGEPTVAESPSTTQTDVGSAVSVESPSSVASSDLSQSQSKTEPQALPNKENSDRPLAPVVEPLPNKNAVVKEQERNAEMVTAIRAGNLKVIRRLVEVQGLNPTYVYTHEFNPATRVYEGRISRLRLSDIFGDTSTLRNDKVGLDQVLSLFLELGMDVKATLPAIGTKASQIERTAWGPSLRFMETARDREARLRTMEVALQAGLVPNEEIRDWLFAEITQVCGRDRSKFAIQVVDLLIKHLGPSMGTSLQEGFWRFSERGPETVSDVLDRSFAPPQPKNYIEKAEFALQDDMWEQCAPLSRRVNRFLTQGN